MSLAPVLRQCLHAAAITSLHCAASVLHPHPPPHALISNEPLNNAVTCRPLPAPPHPKSRVASARFDPPVDTPSHSSNDAPRWATCSAIPGTAPDPHHGHAPHRDNPRPVLSTCSASPPG